MQVVHTWSVGNYSYMDKCCLHCQLVSTCIDRWCLHGHWPGGLHGELVYTWTGGVYMNIWCLHGHKVSTRHKDMWCLHGQMMSTMDRCCLHRQVVSTRTGGVYMDS